MRTVRLASCLFVLLACGKSDPPPPPPSTAASGSAVVPAPKPAQAAAGLEKLRVLVDGTPVPMLKAFIKRVSPEQWRVQVGDLEGSCGELISGVMHVQKGGTSFVATIVKRLFPDGKEAIVVSDFTSGSLTTRLETPAKITGAATKDAKVELELAKLVATSARPAGADGIAIEKKLEISGPFTATGCGDQPDDNVGVPKGPVTSSATITIAGKKLDIRGAILRGNEVVLSTGPKDCSPATPFAPVVVQFTGGKWELSGTAIAKPETATATMKGVTFKVVDKATTEDGPVVALELAGQGKLGAYAVQFAGTILALDCKL
jgi:hypothetical protein